MSQPGKEMVIFLLTLMWTTVVLGCVWEHASALLGMFLLGSFLSIFATAMAATL